MIIANTVKSVQFLVNQKGERTGVLLDIHDWELIVNWIENVIMPLI